MAIYHLNVSVGTRKRGHSSEAKYNYICRRGQFAECKKSNGKNETRSSKDVLFRVSKNLPEWTLGSSEYYWVAADVLERKNAILYREIEFALPRELDLVENEKTAIGFADLVAIQPAGLLPYTLAIHGGDLRNPHCHMMLSEKINDGVERSCEKWFQKAKPQGIDPTTGGARKADIVNQKGWLLQVRQLWAQLCNEALAQNGADQLISHLSYAARGIERLPQIHIGARLMSAIKINKIPLALEHRLYKYARIEEHNNQLFKPQNTEDKDQDMDRGPSM